jgi:hypothetical protein
MGVSRSFWSVGTPDSPYHVRVKLNYALIIAETEMSPEEYEELTRTLMENLASRFGLLTTRLQRDVTLQGRSTSNQMGLLKV